MKTAEYIKELLYTNKSVVIPGLGCFVGEYASARIVQDKEGKSWVTPPYKKITIDASLQNDDALLSSYVAQKESISLQEAEAMIATDVAELHAEMKNEKHIVLKGVGTIYYNSAGTVSFDPDEESNLLGSSYGMGPVAATLLDETQKATTTTTVIKKKKLNLRPLLWIIPVLLLLLGLFFIYTKTDWMQRSKDYIVSLFEKDEPDTSNIVLIDTVDIAKPDSLLADTGNKDTVSVVANGKTTFYLVAGSFMEYKNAERLQKLLLAQGYPSELLPKEAGLYRVTFRVFNNKPAAVAEMGKLKKVTQDEDIWVLSK